MTKASGIEWIGEIPKHWNVMRLKMVIGIRIIAGQSPPSESYADTEGVYFLQGCENFGLMYPRLNTRTLQPTNIVNKNDLLISVRAPVGEFNLANEKICIGRGLAGIVTNGLIIHYKFLYYFMFVGKIQLYSESRGSTYDSIRINELENLLIVIPPLEEQKSIVQFLDERINHIDAVIDKKQKIIRLLNEKSQAIIDETVRRGLITNAITKDSGIQWIGEVPEHWRVSRLKYHTSKIGSGITPRGGSKTYLENGIPLIRSQNVQFSGLALNEVVFISRETHDEMKDTKLREHDVLLNITGASIGRCTMVPNGFVEGNVNQHVCIIRPTEALNPQFLCFYLSSSPLQGFINAVQVGASRQGLAIDEVGSMNILAPPISEQSEISNYLNQTMSKFNNVLRYLHQQIERLKEYRYSLISSAVSGKIDVLEGTKIRCQ